MELRYGRGRRWLSTLDVSIRFDHHAHMANSCTSSVVMKDLVEKNYVSTVSTDGATMESLIQYNYSIGMNPIYLEVKMGVFLGNPQTSTSAPPTMSPANQGKPAPNTITLLDENYIGVTLVVSGGDIANNVYRFRTSAGKVEKRGDQFFEATHPNGSPCMVYYGVNSARYYWTWTLDL